MSVPSLTALLGSQASQDSSSLTIAKTDLVSVGLTPSANNAAESLMLAIIKLARVGQDNGSDTQMSISAPIVSTLQRNGNNIARYRYNVDFFISDANPSEPDPDSVA